MSARECESREERRGRDELSSKPPLDLPNWLPTTQPQPIDLTPRFGLQYRGYGLAERKSKACQLECRRCCRIAAALQVTIALLTVMHRAESRECLMSASGPPPMTRSFSVRLLSVRPKAAQPPMDHVTCFGHPLSANSHHLGSGITVYPIPEVRLNLPYF